MKKILVPICNRTNYTKLKPVLNLLNENLNMVVVASSGIVVGSRGSGMQDIVNDGLIISHKIDCLLMNDSLESMAKTTGLSMIEHASILSKEKPDAALIVGDRFDMLPAAVASLQMNIPIFHIQGGEKSGSIDDSVRDLITVMASRHYVATEQSYDHVFRIARNKSVMNAGCPAVEFVQGLPVGERLDVNSFKKKYTNNFGILPDEKYIAVCVHPNTVEDQDVDMASLLDAVLSTGLKCIVIYPNVDAFNSNITIQIRRHEKQIICVRHMPVEDFVKIMAHATCLVGNSSSGIREAASFGTPVVNVGSRQRGRERNLNVLDCGSSFETIKQAIETSITRGRFPRHNIYFRPDAAKNIAHDILLSLEK